MTERACDACGKAIAAGQQRFTLAIEVFAPYDELEVDAEELTRDRSAELRALAACLAALDPDEAQDDIHRGFRFTLCRPCQRAYLRAPLRPDWPAGPAS